jgi:hypothetical protein
MWRQERGDSRLPNKDWMYLIYGAGMVLAAQLWVASLLYGALLLAEVLLIGRRYKWGAGAYMRRACLGAFGAGAALLLFLLLMGYNLLEFPSLFAGNVSGGSGFREMTSEQYVQNLGIPGLWSWSLLLGWAAVRREWRMLLALLCAILVISCQHIHDFRTLYLIPFLAVLLFSGVQRLISMKRGAFRIPVSAVVTMGVGFMLVNSFVRRNVANFYRRDQRNIEHVSKLFREQTAWSGKNVYVFSDDVYTTGLELGWRMWALRYRTAFRPDAIDKPELTELLAGMDYVVMARHYATSDVEAMLRSRGFVPVSFRQEILEKHESLYGPYALWERKGITDE